MRPTPGPWELAEDEGSFVFKMGTAIMSPGQFQAQHLIEWEHGLEYDPDAGKDDPENRQYLEAKANAHLIAAAPDMLEVAKAYEAWETDLLQTQEAWETPDGYPRMTPSLYDRWMEIQEMRNRALRKARGEEAPS